MNKGISVDLSQMGEYHLDELEQLVGALLGEIECAEYVPTEEYERMDAEFGAKTREQIRLIRNLISPTEPEQYEPRDI
ncbi:hypothetical protein P4571_08565 [Niallia alba]|uniref:hypothetical protein n=1 Tax=Niallia alba TaxID=2729105 RepID=UPI002E1D0FDC|nr:hypothetical protein [Niallia alba]